MNYSFIGSVVSALGYKAAPAAPARFFSLAELNNARLLGNVLHTFCCRNDLHVMTTQTHWGEIVSEFEFAFQWAPTNKITILPVEFAKCIMCRHLRERASPAICGLPSNI